MNLLQALFLGILQGFTEFLPISSSGHLVIFQYYMGFKKPMVLFDVLLHIGTLAAVIVFFRKELKLMLISILKPQIKDEDYSNRRWIILMVILGTLPTAILGAILQREQEFLFKGVFVSGGGLLFTGVFLWLAEKIGSNSNKKNCEKQKITPIDALIIGVMQGVAIIPGISRSGTTISTGLIKGLKREVSFQYSFFLFIPAVTGALILESRKVSLISSTPSFPVCLAGTLTSFLVGIVALKILHKLLREKRLTIFSWYCWIFGGGVLVYEIAKIFI
ncbi:undecaprenyl-diphosphate phosphatase [Candidatus Aerophobetes bacterium]|nr:undecaprenyl-diphosphate phosphatase [Candidatus Aerophobetes bacterium]